jgi:6-pyruvoyltetrahydropterin/6-carboxytetrahydropterin synthase
MTVIRAVRYHDFSCGHRVHNHESKCAHLHGHNYRVTFTCELDKGLDSIGRVIDFSVIKSLLCQWLEDNWDHKFLAWQEDAYMKSLVYVTEMYNKSKDPVEMLLGSIVWVPFNPTAENMADYLLRVIGPCRLLNTGVTLVEVSVEETRKCSATATLEKVQKYPCEGLEDTTHG